MTSSSQRSAAALPALCVITDSTAHPRGLLPTLALLLQRPPPMPLWLVLRAPGHSEANYASLAHAVMAMCRKQASVCLMLHTHAHLVGPVGARGCHVPSTHHAQLRSARMRMPPRSWLTTSVHNEAEANRVCAHVDGVWWGPLFAPLTSTKTPMGKVAPPAHVGAWALGGMTPARFQQLRSGGFAFSGAATIGSIMAEHHPRAALDGWAEVLR
jgi:thiamine monophosphate synthase